MITAQSCDFRVRSHHSHAIGGTTKVEIIDAASNLACFLLFIAEVNDGEGMNVFGIISIPVEILRCVLFPIPDHQIRISPLQTRLKTKYGPMLRSRTELFLL